MTPLWQHLSFIKLVAQLPVHVQKVHFWGERSFKSSAATCKQENIPDLSLPSAKSEKLGKAKTTASVNYQLLKNLYQASLFS